MSLFPSQPQGTGQTQPNRSRAFLLAFLTVAVAAGGLGILALNYRGGKQESNPAGAASTATQAAVATPQRQATSARSVFYTVLPAPPSTFPPSPTYAPALSHTPDPTATLKESSPTRQVTTAINSATSTAQVTSQTTSTLLAEQAKATLDAAVVPMRDLYSITARLRLKTGKPIARTTSKPPGNYKAGHTETFYMNDILARSYYTITAQVREVTDHVYWYAQTGQPVDEAALKAAALTFEEKIYPTDHQLFGTEWTPGVDNDPRITVLFASIPGAGGYYASADEYTHVVNPFSNQREIIYVNTSGGFDGVEGTLAHEFQHMIHWHQNPGHDVWLNEGASVLASVLNGYDAVGVDGDFMRGPDVQLNAWQPNPDAARANYGASMLFLDFLRDHYGGDSVLRAIVAAKGQGTDAIDNALAALGSPDHFIDAYRKWILANAVDGQPGVTAKGLDYPDRQVEISPGAVVKRYPNSQADAVSQFGTDYVQLSPPQSGSTLEVNFAGDPTTKVIAAPVHSGTGIWWSNRGDLADTTMTRAFDLKGLNSATLQFYTWFDTEEDLDYGYVEASGDNGVTWDTLKGRHTTGTNPNGNNLGNGYTGKSKGRAGADQSGWLQEQIDLSAYGGKKVLLRFEYITDDGYNAGGMAVDDISIPELGYKSGAETEDGWQGEGFARVPNSLPQTYSLSVIKYRSDGFDVQPVEVDPTGKANFEVQGLGGPDAPYTKAMLVISATTTHSVQPAHYELNIRAK